MRPAFNGSSAARPASAAAESSSARKRNGDLILLLIITFYEKEKKMYKKVFLLSLVVILFAGYAEAGDPRDGIWWNNLDMGQKQLYVEGLSNGIGLAQMVILHDKTADKKFKAAVEGAYQSYMGKYFSNVTTTQISDGLDAFYSNYENVNIKTDKACWLVLKILHDDPEDEIRDLIKTWKKLR
jgi:hypothetical protein